MKLVVHEAVRGQIEALAQRRGGTVLLHGKAHVGKRTAALDISRRLNCAGCSDERCRSCRMALGGNHPNIIVVEPDEKGKIGIEAVHELQHALQYEQYEAAGRRVVIIVAAETLTLPAQNALLKTLEEPPAGTLMLLTAQNPANLLPTVQSRCTMLYMPLLTAAVIREQLARLRPAAAQDAEQIARLSRGAIGQAISFAEVAGERQRGEAIQKAVRAVMAAPSLFERLLAVAAVTPTEDRAEYLDELMYQVAVAARVSGGRNATEAVLHLRQRLQANVNPKTAFEALAVELT